MTLSADRLSALDAFVLDLNRASAAAILPLFRADHGLEDKGTSGAFDPVTEADRGAEEPASSTMDDGPGSWEGDGSTEVVPDDGEWGGEAAGFGPRQGAAARPLAALKEIEQAHGARHVMCCGDHRAGGAGASTRKAGRAPPGNTPPVGASCGSVPQVTRPSQAAGSGVAG